MELIAIAIGLTVWLAIATFAVAIAAAAGRSDRAEHRRRARVPLGPPQRETAPARGAAPKRFAATLPR